jgi:hypothetical protein
MNRIRLILHRLFRRPVITDPMRITTRRLADGLALDLEEYCTYVIETIADDEDLLNQLMEVVEDRQNARAHRHDGWEPEQLLVENLAAGVGTEVRVRGEALRRLGERLLSAAPKPKPETGAVVRLPGQRQAGAA